MSGMIGEKSGSGSTRSTLFDSCLKKCRRYQNNASDNAYILKS
jgi:hypothetical protein